MHVDMETMRKEHEGRREQGRNMKGEENREGT